MLPVYMLISIVCLMVAGGFIALAIKDKSEYKFIGGVLSGMSGVYFLVAPISIDKDNYNVK